MRFKIEFEIQTNKAITPDELKYEIKKNLTTLQFTMAKMKK